MFLILYTTIFGQNDLSVVFCMAIWDSRIVYFWHLAFKNFQNDERTQQRSKILYTDNNGRARSFVHQIGHTCFVLVRDAMIGGLNCKKMWKLYFHIDKFKQSFSNWISFIRSIATGHDCYFFICVKSTIAQVIASIFVQCKHEIKIFKYFAQSIKLLLFRLLFPSFPCRMTWNKES